MHYSVTRQSLMKYVLGPETAPFASITLKNRLWPTEGAALANVLGDTLTDYPSLMIDGAQYQAHRKLLSNRLLVNDYDAWLLDADGAEVIRCFLRGAGWSSQLRHLEKTYVLRRTSFFSFRFTLTGNGIRACLTDTTPFLTVSSRRSFEIESDSSIDHILLCFSVFLATTSAFG